ncbi:MAG: transposase [Verrucomicrobiae bacterium]|nr:transposase [Verrucomicrobiae bacterium]
MAEKRRWHSEVSDSERALGFSGWRSRGYLPHFDLPGVWQFVTYRLNDALPAVRRREWEGLCQIEDDRLRHRKTEAYVDRGYGSCVLRRKEIAAIVEENLLHFDGERYRLLAWCIMPNHVHIAVEVWQRPLAELVHSWKSYTATQAQRLLGKTGAFWQSEYFDRYLRDENHFQRVVRYVEYNPVKARLCASPGDWPWSSARFRDERSAGGPPARIEGNPNAPTNPC